MCTMLYVLICAVVHWKMEIVATSTDECAQVPQVR